MFDEIERTHLGSLEAEVLSVKLEVSAALDGGDGVGKNTTLVAMIELLQEASVLEINGKEIYSKDIGLMVTNYPAYFSPAGYLVNIMNHGGFENFQEWRAIHGAKDLTLDEELNLRMALYSLDRIMSWMVLDRATEKFGKPIIHISDRSPHSQVMTIIYTLKKYGKLDEKEKYLVKVLDADSLISKLFPWRPVILLKSQQQAGKFADEKKNVDQLEDVGTQTAADIALREMTSNPALGYEHVYTQDGNGEFKDKYSIAREALEKVGIKIKKNKNRILSRFLMTDRSYVMSNTIYSDNIFKPPFFYTPRMFYKVVLEDLVRFVGDKMPRIGNQRFGDYIDDVNIGWELANGITSFWHRLAGQGQARKDILHNAEKSSAYAIASVMSVLGVSREFIQNCSPQVLDEIMRLCGPYTGGLLQDLVYFLEENTGEESEMPHGVTRFLDLVAKVVDQK